MKLSLVLAATLLPGAQSSLPYSVDGDTVTKCVNEVCASNNISDRSTWSLSDLTSVPPKAAGEHPTSDGKWTVDENGLSFSPNAPKGVNVANYKFPWTCQCGANWDPSKPSLELPSPWGTATEYDITYLDAPHTALDVALLNSDEVLITGWDGETRCSIRKMRLSTGEITPYVGGPCGGSYDGKGTEARFEQRPNVYIEGKHILVLEGWAGKLRKIDPETLEVTTLAQGFHHDKDAAIVGDYAYITDSHNNVVARFNLVTNEFVKDWAGTYRKPGTRSEGVNGAPGTAIIYSGFGIANAGNGYLIVADGFLHCIRKIEIATGVVSPFVGKCGEVGFKDGTGEEARFQHPRYIAVSGDIAFITGPNNRALRRVVISTGVVTTVDTPGIFSDPWGIDVDNEQIVFTGGGATSQIAVVKIKK